MSLSTAIKASINAPHACGGTLAVPPLGQLTSLIRNFARRGEIKGGIDHRTWLTLSTGTLVTINSPASLCALYSIASNDSVSGHNACGSDHQVEVASIVREAALKCISFSGIPRTINALSSLRQHLPVDVRSKLTNNPVRELRSQNLLETQQRGRRLWDDIYQPFSTKLLQRLAESHPDLPIHILISHYAQLLSDPEMPPPSSSFSLGRTLTSLLAVACLRAQTGVAAQLTSHIHGLKKASVDTGEIAMDGQEWLTSNEGIIWVLESVDALAAMVRSGKPNQFEHCKVL